MLGFWDAETKPFGPVHEYAAPATMLAVRFNDEPVHTGLLEDATGEDGIGFTVTATVPAALVQPEAVAVTL